MSMTQPQVRHVRRLDARLRVALGWLGVESIHGHVVQHGHLAGGQHPRVGGVYAALGHDLLDALHRPQVERLGPGGPDAPNGLRVGVVAVAMGHQHILDGQFRLHHRRRGADKTLGGALGGEIGVHQGNGAARVLEGKGVLLEPVDADGAGGHREKQRDASCRSLKWDRVWSPIYASGVRGERPISQ